MLTLANYRDYLVPRDINGATVRFLVANGETVEAARPKIEVAGTFLAALPRQHLAAAFPIIFIAGSLPSPGHGGGTPGHPETLIRRRADDIGAEADAMEELLRTANSGLRTSSFHWIPRHVYDDAGRLPYTVAHEVIHAVDLNLGLHVRRRTGSDPARNFTTSDLPGSLRGQACQGGPEAIRISVNAYLCLISGLRHTSAREREMILENLRLSRAFESVPEDWWSRYESH